MVRLGMVALLALGLAACVGRPSDDAGGEEIYLQLCATCHADDYRGGVGPALGPGSNAANRPAEFMRVSVLEGRGRMPSFRSSLSDQQVETLIEHLLEVQGR